MTAKRFNGQNNANDQTHPYNTLDFLIRQRLSAVSTATLVKVVGVSNSGNVDKIGTVDILPLVNLMDGAGDVTKHVTIKQIPYMRTVGGSKGIIMDPKVGDIGVVVFCDRDIQSVRNAKGQASPGSKRRFSMADAIYITSVISDAPTSYLQFEDDGTITVSPDNGTTKVRVKAQDVKVTIGSTVVSVKQNEIYAKAGLEVWIRPTRIDLGMKDAPHRVWTEDGPSNKVFAIIDENPSS